MAIAIPEAAEAVTGGEAAISGAGAKAAARPGSGKVIRAQKVQDATYTSRIQPPAGPDGARQPSSRRPRVQPVIQPGGRSKGGRRPSGGRKSTGAGRYQPAILAEFLIAMIVIAVPPLAKGGDTTAQAKGSPSPYSTDTMKQLIAAGAVYFILALLSGSQKLGRYAAWFGGLTLLGIGLLQTANGDLTALFKIFGPSNAGANPAQVAADQPLASQDVAGALGGALGGGTATVPVQNATGIFPTVAPGGQVTANIVSPPPGGNGVVTTTGNDQGANLA